MTDVKKTKTV
jgi:hypothetical protein